MVDQTRAKNISIAGAVVQSALGVVLLVTWLWTGSPAAMACTLVLAGGVPLWLVLAVTFYARRLEHLEQVELEELRKQETSTIFEQGEEADLRPAAARVAFIHKWVFSVFTLLWMAYHGAIGVLVLRWAWGRSAPTIEAAQKAVWLLVPAALIGFLFSRYATGMSRRTEWRMLRGAGSYLLVCVLAMAAVIISMVAVYQQYSVVDRVVTHILPAIQIVLAVELALNFVLDLYRPRLPGEEPRPSFESRLLSLVAEPGRVGHSLAEALNYQFGFEVSGTWFYRLVSRAFVPLLLFGVAVLIGISSIVIVRDGQQVVVSRWGRVQYERGLLGPGLHFKWPWPVDTARHFDVGSVHEITLGVGAEREPQIIKGREIYLWTEEHGRRQERNFLVAIPSRRRQAEVAGEQPPPPVQIIKLVVVMRYVIDDVLRYGFAFTDAESVLEALAYTEMTNYCARASLDEPIDSVVEERPEAIMTFGRERAAMQLHNRIQQRADEMDLGVRILEVGITAAHPPQEAAAAFEEYVEAERETEVIRYQAETEANRMLAEVAGDPSTALRLGLAIRKLDELETLDDLRSNPTEQAARLEEFIRIVGNDIETLESEIGQEQLLGRVSPAREALLEEYRQWLETLQGIRAEMQADGDLSLAARIEEAQELAEDRFSGVAGTAAATFAQARAYRWQRQLGERARAENFRRELLAYRASPEMYMLDRWLDVWDEVLPGMHKYVLGVDRDRIEVWLNLERETGVLEGMYGAGDDSD
ncbi:MAG: SPFH domain-containing protein [Phycisphaerae bacterium]